MAKKRAELLSEIHNTKSALRASERRGRRSVKRLRDLEKIFAPIIERMEFWADSALAPEANAFKVLTVGQCRALLPYLRGEAELPEEEEAPQAPIAQEAA